MSANAPFFVNKRSEWVWIRRVSALSLVALFLIWPARAVALYRGDEFTFRSFDVGDLFFINRATYQPSPEVRDWFRTGTNVFMGAAGSLTGDDLYLLQHLKLAHPIRERWTLNFEYLRDRDFDGHFQHVPMSLAYQPTPAWSVALVGEPDPDKENADIGLAFALDTRPLNVRLQWLAVDFVFDRKNPDNAIMERRAPNLQFDMEWQMTMAARLFFHADIDPSRTLFNPAKSFRFRFQKYQGRAGVRWFLSDNTYVESTFEGEHTRKTREGLEEDDPKAFIEDRDYALWRLEYYGSNEAEVFWRAGLMYVLFDEDRHVPNNPAQSQHTDRSDHLAYAGRTWALRDRWHLNTQLFLNWMDSTLTRADEAELREKSQLAVRLATSFILRSDHYQLEVGAAVNAHQARFGGGFVKAWADF